MLAGDARRRAGQHERAVAERDRFRDVMGDEHDGLAAEVPQPQQILLQLRPGLRIERTVSPELKVLHPGLNRRVGYVTQDDNLLPWRTTIDNVLFPREVQGTLDAAARARAQELIDAVGLTGFERYYPHELSGGMRKRAALIRTLVYDPPVILMDEPFAAVDAQTRTQLQEDLLRLWEMGRKTIIFVTHDIAEAVALGDRTLVLTKQPTRIAAEHVIPIPRPRNVQDIFALEGFATVYERIRAAIQ